MMMPSQHPFEFSASHFIPHCVVVVHERLELSPVFLYPVEGDSE